MTEAFIKDPVLAICLACSACDLCASNPCSSCRLSVASFLMVRPRSSVGVCALPEMSSGSGRLSGGGIEAIQLSILE